MDKAGLVSSIYTSVIKIDFGIACESHKTRLKNIIRSPGIDHIEKDLLKQRLANLFSAQSGYIALQKKAIEG